MRASAERHELLRLSERVERAASLCRDKLRLLPASSAELAKPEIRAQLNAFALPDPFYAERNTLRGRVYEPLSALHRQLCNRMILKLDSETSGEVPRRFSFSQALSILKNSNDPRLRKAIFCSMNAWIAERGELFADLQSAVEGCRKEAAAQSGLSNFGYMFRTEHITPETYSALFSAIRGALPKLRRTVSLRAPVFG